MDAEQEHDARSRWSSVPVGPGAPGQTDASDPSEWRWRNYTDHLDDLGYELDGTPAAETEADELSQAVAEYRRRSRPAG